MKSNDQLFQFIKSLNKSEKRQYKLYARRYAVKGESTQLVQLFDAIDAQEGEYDEAKVLRKFKDRSVAQHLFSLKSKLEEQILESLELMQDENYFVNIQIRRWLNQHDILVAKGLKQAAKLRLQRAKQKAEKYELWLLQSHILLLEIRLSAVTDHEQRRDLLQQAQKIAEYSQLNMDYHADMDRVREIFGQWGAGKHNINYSNEIKSMLQAERYQFLPPTAPFYHQLNVYSLHCFYAIYSNDREKALEYSAKMMQLWDSNPCLKSQEPSNYVAECIRYASILNSHALDFKGSNDILQRALHLLDTPHMPAAWREHRKYSILGLQLNNLFQLQEWADFEATLSQLSTYRGKESEETKHEFIANSFDIALLLYATSRFDQAMDWVQYIINQRERSVVIRADLLISSYILCFIINFEQKNRQLLEHDFQSTYRFLYKNQCLGVSEKIILGFMRKIVTGYQEKEDLNPYYIKLIEKIKNTPLDPNDETSLNYYFPFELWLKSKINQQPFIQAIRLTKKPQQQTL